MSGPSPLPARLAQWSYRSVSTALAITDASGSILECNPAFADACHTKVDELLGLSIVDALSQPPKSALATAYRTVGTSGTGRAAVVIAGNHGDEDAKQWDVRLEYQPADELVYVMGTDLTRESKLTAEVQARTIRDRLTGLENRDAFKDELDAALANGNPVALYIVDVDRFSTVNDTYGHELGDSVLLLLSRRLVRLLGVRTTVARIGGDQFAVMVRRLSDPSLIREVAERLHQALTEELVIDRTSLHLRISIGFSFSGTKKDSAADLLREADTALSRASDLGGNQIQQFHVRFHEEVARRMKTEADLRQALGSPQLDADVQGVFTADRRQLVGFEALARWRHPERGTVPPDDFIDVADRYGLLDHVLRAVLERSLSTLNPWLAQDQTRHLAVNVAPSQLLDRQVVSTIESAIEMSGVSPSQLVVEVTERELITDPTSIATIKDLRSLGVRIAIDDFGAGASALGYLWTLPVSILKLDRWLTSSMMTDPAARRIVASLISLSHDLGLRVVAEGVELEEELMVLAELRCTHAQGYWLHRPCSLTEVGQIIETADGSAIVRSHHLAP